MHTFNRICIKDFEIKHDDGIFIIKRGKEYITSPIDDDGNVFVYSTYWLSVPANIFAGEIEFTPPDNKT